VNYTIGIILMYATGPIALAFGIQHGNKVNIDLWSHGKLVKANNLN